MVSVPDLIELEVDVVRPKIAMSTDNNLSVTDIPYPTQFILVGDCGPSRILFHGIC